MNLFKLFFRKNTRRATLVLSSGAAGGMAHVGVIKAIEEAGIGIDAIAGSSMGALVGACYASKASIEGLAKVMLSTDWKRLLALADFNLAFMLKGFVRGEKVKDLLRTIVGDLDFKDLSIPLAVTATDIATGKGVVIREGSVLEAVRASISIPVIFTPAKIGSRYYCDGGVVNPVPIDAARDLSKAGLIVSNTTHNPERKTEARRKDIDSYDKAKQTDEVMAYDQEILQSFNAQADKLIEQSASEQKESKKFLEGINAMLSLWSQKGDPELPNIFTVMLQSLYSMEHRIANLQIKGCRTVITPDIASIDTLEFYRGKEAIALGYAAAKKVLSKRKKYLFR